MARGPKRIGTFSVRRTRNPVPPSSKSLTNQIDTGKRAYKRFSGHDAEEIGSIIAPEMPEVAVAIGEIHAIEYDTVRDGKYEKYRHVFHKNSRPLFCISPDGKLLLMIGGSYNFTERGIVDTDAKGRPVE